MPDHDAFELRLEQRLRVHAMQAAGRPAPDAVARAVAARQAVGVPGLRGRPAVSRRATWALAAAALIALSLGAAALGGAFRSPAPDAVPSPSPAASTGPSATPVAGASPSLAPWLILPSAAPVDDAPLVAIAAGRSSVVIDLYNFHYDREVFEGTPYKGGRVPGGQARVNFDLPSGWFSDGRTLFKGAQRESAPISIAPWTIGLSYRDPCRRGDANLINDPPLLLSVTGMATALFWAGGPNAPTKTSPVDAELAGLAARYLEARSPASIDPATCDDGLYAFWLDPTNNPRVIHGPGQHDRFWVVDVGADPSDLQGQSWSAGGRERDPAKVADGSVPPDPGGIMVLVASSLPGATPAEIAELLATVASIEIELVDRR